MQVSIDKISQVYSKINLEIPAEEIQKLVNSKINQISKTVKMDGFRSGKVPMKVVIERYGFSVYQEVIGELLGSKIEQIISEYKLDPVMEPNLEKMEQSNLDGKFDVASIKPLNCIFGVEVYPEVQLRDFAELAINIPVAPEITAIDLEQQLIEIRKTYGSPVKVDRAAAVGDLVNISYTGTVLEGGKEEIIGNDVNVHLGKGEFIEGFETGLIGFKAEDEIELALTFSEKYADLDLAGKGVNFKIKVNAVSEIHLSELDQALAKTLNVEDPTKIQEKVKTLLEDNAQELIKEIKYANIKEALIKAYPIELPKKLLDLELSQLRQNFLQHNRKQGVNIKKINPLILDELILQAKQNVHLSILLREIIKQHNLTINQKVFNEQIQQFDQYFKRFKNFKQMKANYANSVANSTLTQLALDFVINQAQQNTITMNLEQLKKLHTELYN